MYLYEYIAELDDPGMAYAQKDRIQGGRFWQNTRTKLNRKEKAVIKYQCPLGILAISTYCILYIYYGKKIVFDPENM